MTAPRIISAAEARTLLEDSTPGPWAVDERVACAGVVSPALARSPGLGRDYEGVIAYWSPPLGTTLDPMHPRWSHERPGDMMLIAAAPDLAASVVALHARAEQAEANYRWMVERAADQRLDGYRELGARCAALEAERDAAADAERARIAARIKDLADRAYSAGNEPRGDALLNASRIVQTSRVTP